MMRRGVIIDGVVTFTGVGMDNDLHQGRELMKEHMPHLFRDEVSLQHGQLTIHGHMHLAPQAVPNPADRRAVDIPDAIYL